MTPARFPILTTRPQCAGCQWATKGPGCAYLHDGTPCGHPIERRRFTSDSTPEREATEASENQTGVKNVS